MNTNCNIDPTPYDAIDAICSQFGYPNELMDVEKSWCAHDRRGTELTITSVVPDTTNDVFTIYLDIRAWKRRWKNVDTVRRLHRNYKTNKTHIICLPAKPPQ